MTAKFVNATTSWRKSVRCVYVGAAFVTNVFHHFTILPDGSLHCSVDTVSLLEAKTAECDELRAQFALGLSTLTEEARVLSKFRDHAWLPSVRAIQDTLR
jgi:hypothetical protein